MPLLRYFKKVQLMDSLIRRKATGNQRQFAHKVGMSRALLNIYLSEMRNLGFPIQFCRTRNTYYYEEEGKMVSSLFEKTLEREEMKKLHGGTSVFCGYFEHHELLNIDSLVQVIR